MELRRNKLFVLVYSSGARNSVIIYGVKVYNADFGGLEVLQRFFLYSRNNHLQTEINRAHWE